MANRFCGFLFASFIACSCWNASAQTMQVLAPHLAHNPTIDGKVSAEEQAGAARVTLTLVGAFDKPKHQTSAYLFMNDGGIYVGFICDEPAMAGIITKSTKENGAVFDDDSVQFFISPNRDASKTNYFHFAVNAAGVKYSDSMADDKAVDGWQGAASKGTQTWEAEMFIPFSAIGGESEAPYWRMNLARERPARNGEDGETTAWINPGASLHNYKRFGFLQLRQQAPAMGAAIGTVGGAIVGSAGPAGTSAMLSAPSAAGAGAMTTGSRLVQTETTATVVAAPVRAVMTPAAAVAVTTTAIFAGPR